MNGRQDYDVLGFIYVYLISQFTVNTDKKAGEYYMPQEISLLMSEIVAYHQRDKKKIQIYDPTSSFCSLLINISQYFFFSMGHLIKKYVFKNASGSIFLKVLGEQMDYMDISVPIPTEQFQIGGCFQNFGNLISLHQKELEELKTSKKPV